MTKYIKPFFVLLLFIGMYSCTVSKKVKSGKDVQIIKGGENNGTDVVVPDTNDTDKDKPTTTEKGTSLKPSTVGTKRNSYKVAMMLPLSSSDADQKYLQYLAGAKVAASILEEEGISLNIDVLNSTTDVSSKINTSSTDIIFAPNDEAQIKNLVTLGKTNQIPVVSPFFSLSSVENNPFYVQIKPSLKSHFTAMVNHAAKKYSAKDVVIVGRDTKSDRAGLKNLQSGGKVVFKSSSDQVFEELILAETNIDFKEMLAKGKKVFIFPNYSFKDEVYLTACMATLLTQKGGKSVNVYTMPLIKDLDKMNNDIYFKLNVRFPTSKYIDETSSELKAFNAKFFDSCGGIPDADAYEGYDNLLFIGRSIAKHGTNFQFNLTDEESPYLQSTFDIQAFKNEGSINEIDYYENKYLHLLEFNGSKFVPTK